MASVFEYFTNYIFQHHFTIFEKASNSLRISVSEVSKILLNPRSILLD